MVDISAPCVGLLAASQSLVSGLSGAPHVRDHTQDLHHSSHHSSHHANNTNNTTTTSSHSIAGCLSATD